MTKRYFSFGGGVQSMAVLVLTVQGNLHYDAFLFANVGDDSENPATIEYVERVAKPYAEEHNITLIELWHTRKGERESLLGRIQRSERSLPLPVRMSNGAPGRRTCTSDFKIDVIARWQKKWGGATKDAPCVTGLGISMDEWQRARTDSGIAWQVLEYPLIDLRMTRLDCMRVIEQAGLPVPPKSSCWFCPFHNRGEWIRMKREEPEQFQKAVELEKLLNFRRTNLGKDEIYLHASCYPLERAVGDQMAMDFNDDDICDSGYCFV